MGPEENAGEAGGEDRGFHGPADLTEGVSSSEAVPEVEVEVAQLRHPTGLMLCGHIGRVDIQPRWSSMGQ